MKTGKISFKKVFKGYILLAILNLFVFTDLSAQQIPLYSQYFYSPFIYNPSYTGISGDLQSRLIYRKQWTDFEGSPETRTLTLDGALANERVGLGMYIYNDVTDIFERFSGYVTYAYHLPLGEDHRLSVGIAGGVQDNNIDYDRIIVRDIDDPLLTDNSFRSTAIDAGAGINYSWRDLNVGFSVPQIIETELRHLNTKEFSSYSLARHYLFNVSYDLRFWEDKISLQPLLMFRTTSGNPFQVDVNALAGYKDWFWLGVSYRYDYAMTFSAAFQVHDNIQVGYAYDHAINNIASYSGATHEIMLGVRFGRRSEKPVKSTVAPPSSEEDIAAINNKIAQQDSLIADLREEVDSIRLILQGSEVRIEESSEDVRDLINQIREIEEELGIVQTDEDRISFLEVDSESLEYVEGPEQELYYLVVGSFSVRENAQSQYRRLVDIGYDSGIIYDRVRGFNYVYIAQPETLFEGMELLYQLREETGEFGDAWIHIMK